MVSWYPGKLVNRLFEKDDMPNPVSGKLVSGGFADQSIVKYVEEINSFGFPTLASCSGMRRDHHGVSESAYLSIELPEKVAPSTPYVYFVHYVAGKGWSSIDEHSIKDWNYINILVNAGTKADWLAHPSVYMLMFPDVRFYIPRTDSVQTENRVISDPRLVAANLELEKSHGGNHKEWKLALDRRDAIEQDLFKQYVYDWSDEEKDQAWQTLVACLWEAARELSGKR